MSRAWARTACSTKWRGSARPPAWKSRPDGSSVFLLTGLRRPGKDNGQREQTVVLRSDDQGKSWRRLEEGFMAEANRLGWALAPRFHGKDEVWVWGDFE